MTTSSTGNVIPLAGAKRPLLSRDMIIAMARQIVASEGHEALSLRRLAARLGVTAAALYAHVDNKLDLLRAISAAEFETMTKRYEQIEEPCPLQRIRRIAHTYVDFARENTKAFRVMFLFPPVIVAADGGVNEPLGAQAFRSAAAAVEDAIREGKLRNQDPMMASVSIWAAVHGAAEFILLQTDYIEDGGRENDLVDSIVDNLLAGLALPGNTLNDAVKNR